MLTHPVAMQAPLGTRIMAHIVPGARPPPPMAPGVAGVHVAQMVQQIGVQQLPVMAQQQQMAPAPQLAAPLGSLSAVGQTVVPMGGQQACPRRVLGAISARSRRDLGAISARSRRWCTAPR